MAKYINPAKVVTGVCRFSYANLWEAKAMDENSKPKYSVSLIIPKSDTKTIEKIRAAIQAAYEEGQGKLKGNSKSVPPLTSLKTPLRDVQRCLWQSQHHILCVRYKDFSWHCLRLAERPEDSGW